MIQLVAIDVAKDELVCYDGTKEFVVPNTPSKIKKLLSGLAKDTVLALEPTGNYGIAVATLAYKAGFSVFLIQPAWIRSYRFSLGKRAKTDTVDAQLIYSYVRANKERLHTWRPRPEQLQELRKLTLIRHGYASDLARMRLRSRAFGRVEGVTDPVETVIKESIAKLDKQLALALKDIPEAEYLLSVKGVGPFATAHLLVALKHIPFESVDAFIAWAGLDPVANDSGTMQGKRSISKRGDRYLRSALYVVAMSAIRSPVWKERYKALKARGLKSKQAIVALAKKIAKVCFHLFKLKRMFDPEMVKMST